MKQTEHTAIVLRYANYRDNDRMLTLFSPTKGRIEALARGCRKPRSPILNASELFALGDFELYERGNHLTVISANLMETFYPLRADFDRLAVGTYLLGVVENVIQPGVPRAGNLHAPAAHAVAPDLLRSAMAAAADRLSAALVAERGICAAPAPLRPLSAADCGRRIDVVRPDRGRAGLPRLPTACACADFGCAGELAANNADDGFRRMGGFARDDGAVPPDAAVCRVAAGQAVRSAAMLPKE